MDVREQLIQIENKLVYVNERLQDPKLAAWEKKEYTELKNEYIELKNNCIELIDMLEK